MSLLSPSEWNAAQAIAGIGYCNPFLAKRLELERQALGERFVAGPNVRQRLPGQSLAEMFPNAYPMAERGGELLAVLRDKLAGGAPASEDELLVYEDLALVTLYLQYMSGLGGLIDVKPYPAIERITYWRDFRGEFEHYFQVPGRRFPSTHDPAVIFAGLYQIERAHHHIFQYIVGGSMVVARLRGAIWESIFTHDMRRYSRSLHRRMGDIPSLVIGPSGSGKELVARAIGLSRFIPFNAQTERFEADYQGSFHAVNMAAFAPTLIESDLFGHKAGAFTGATEDRDGLLQSCDQLGTVFLDEIGEVETAIQVKLLRVLQERKFQRLGETEDRDFYGKIIAATNRNLAREMQAGRFREDLYYRLCADVVRTPSLLEQLVDSPDDLPNLVRFAVSRVVGEDDAEQASLTREVVAWIEQRLGRDYAWPGNFRELEQCVRNVLIRQEYHAADPAPGDATSQLAAAVAAGELTRDELLDRYYQLVYRRTGSFKAAARRLGVDWRTVRERVLPRSG